MLKRNNFENVQQLQTSVTEVFDTIIPQVLHSVLQSSVQRYYLCLEVNGLNFERL